MGDRPIMRISLTDKNTKERYSIMGGWQTQINGDNVQGKLNLKLSTYGLPDDVAEKVRKMESLLEGFWIEATAFQTIPSVAPRNETGTARTESEF